MTIILFIPKKFKAYIFCIIFLFAFCFTGHAQDEFSKLDSITRTITYKGNLKLLVNELTKNYTSEKEKARAIFVWIADNIAYDYRAINRNKKPAQFKCNGKNCTEKYANWENEYLTKVLNNKEAICDGYARLFKRMCDYAGLRTDVVAGYTKNDVSQIGRMGYLNHAWNGIIIEDKYHFLDVTWAAGGCAIKPDGELLPFKKEFNDYYWLTPANKFMRDHFPSDQNNPLVVNGSKEKYKNTPYIKQAYSSSIDILSHDNGIIEACVGDTIHFKILFKNYLWSKIQVNTNIKPNPDPWEYSGNNYSLNPDKLKKQKFIDYKLEDYVYEFDYIISSKNIRYMDILFDYHKMIRFKIKILQQ